MSKKPTHNNRNARHFAPRVELSHLLCIEWVMQNSAWIGWVSSFVLLLTLAKQLNTQWREKTDRGVSKWLFAGQFVSEIGFVLYSVQVRNWVFVFINVALLLENSAGLWLTFYLKKHESKIQRAA